VFDPVTTPAVTAPFGSIGQHASAEVMRFYARGERNATRRRVAQVQRLGRPAWPSPDGVR
jgi:hypothetical protein